MIIEAIQIRIKTDKGRWGRYLNFLDKEGKRNEVNLIYGDNERGKSTLLRSIIYALGGENIYGPHKGENTNFAIAIRKKVGEEYITSSEILLQISNEQNKRVVIGRNAKNRLEPILVYRNVEINSIGPNTKVERYKAEKDRDIEGNPTFNEFIMGFFGFPSYTARNNKGKNVQIYFQNLLSLFFIHQYAWNDVQATNPTYGVFEMKSLVFQIILNLSEVALIQEKLELQEVRAELSEKQKIKKSLDDIILASEYDNSTSITEQIELLTLDLEYRRRELRKLNETQTSKEESYSPLKLEYKLLNNDVVNLRQEIDTLKKSIDQYSYYINKINIDIEKTDKLRTAKRIISNVPVKQCPHCYNPVNIDAESEIESGKCNLCGQDMKVKDADFRELIDYLKDERNDFLKLQIKKNDLKKNREKELFLKEISAKEIKLKIDQIDLELTPKFLEQYYNVSNKIGGIESRISQLEKGKKIISGYESLVIEINTLENRKKNLEKAIREKKAAMKDSRKLNFFQKEFKQILKDLDFLKYEHEEGEELSKKRFITDSFFRNLFIDKDNYKPKIENENIYFLTSASGIVRIVNAYYLALLKTALNFPSETNHPRILILDEPLQQNLDKKSFEKLTQLYLDLAKDYEDQFQIIYASGTLGAIPENNALLNLFGVNKFLIEKIN